MKTARLLVPFLTLLIVGTLLGCSSTPTKSPDVSDSLRILACIEIFGEVLMNAVEIQIVGRLWNWCTPSLRPSHSLRLLHFLFSGPQPPSGAGFRLRSGCEICELTQSASCRPGSCGRRSMCFMSMFAALLGRLLDWSSPYSSCCPMRGYYHARRRRACLDPGA